MPRYAQCRKDFEYLESIAELDDWAEYHADMHLLLQNPTKAKAAEFYNKMIGQWLWEHVLHRKQSLTPKMVQIRDRHNAAVV
jgi:hypothetical protein